MRQSRLIFSLALAVCFIQGLPARAQTSIDVLEQDLKQVKNEHEQASSQVLTIFFSQLDGAIASPATAMNLYQQAGGTMPDAASVQTKYEHETPTEKMAREQQDAAILANLSNIIQMHCGLMRFGALFIVKPDTRGLHEAWIAWLKSTAATYLQVKKIEDTRTGADPGGKRKEKRDTFVNDFKNKLLKDSVISSYLGFHGWGDKEQGTWSVKRIPDLYREQVLEPLRATPSAETLAAWDVYIAMKNLDEPDSDQWTRVEYPSLMFDRSCDDYQVAPSAEKLAALIELIKANPTHPRLDEMISRTHDLVQDYRSKHAGSASATPAPAPAPASSDPNVTVTTATQGDMTIVTTHTNAPPSNPSPPKPAP